MNVRTIVKLACCYFCVILFSCTSSEKDASSEKNRKELKIPTILTAYFPDNWTIKQEETIDLSKFVIFINGDSTKLLYIEAGYYASALTESEPEIIDDSLYFETMKRSPDFNTGKYVYIRKNGCRDRDFYRKQSIFIDTIAKRTYKKTSPTRKERGMYGYHFYKIKDQTDGIGNYRLSIYAPNIEVKEAIQLDRIIKDIKWQSDCKSCIIN